MKFEKISFIYRIITGKSLEGVCQEDSERPGGVGDGDLLLGGGHAAPQELLHQTSPWPQCQRPQN